jgi:hypothetical protein
MDTVHFREDITVGRNKATLVFFNKSYEDSYDSKYVTMIETAPIIQRDNYRNTSVIEDTLGNVYRVKTMCIDHSGLSASIKKDKVEKLFFLADFKKFLLNNHLPEETQIDEEFAIKHLYHLKIYTKNINRPIIDWDITRILKEQYFVIMIINGEIIGKVNCELLDQKEIIDLFKSKDVMYPTMKLYISNVDIRPDFQGKRLCTPLLTYMIKHLKRLGHEMLFISNASRTREGIPACICYYNAGINNNYKMRCPKAARHDVTPRERLEALESLVFRESADSGVIGGRITKLEKKLLGKKNSGTMGERLNVLESVVFAQESTNHSSFTKMKKSDCTSKPMRREYFYISDSILKRGVTKLKSAVKKIKFSKKTNS